MRPIVVARGNAVVRNCPEIRLLTRQITSCRIWTRSRTLTAWTTPHRTQPIPSRKQKYRSLGSQHNAGFQLPTIYALSSAPGRAAIAVIRLSGPDCLDVYQRLCPGRKIPKARMAAVRSLYEPGSDGSRESVLDSNALVLYFPAPKTVTGEDVLELHVHGGPAIVKAVLSAIAKCGGGDLNKILYAEPGEFTRRAFLNDRIDLTQVEALGDTLSADTEQQRRLSVRGTTGVLAKQHESWRQLLLYARGELEALIDFSEDQHFDESPAELCASVAAQVKVLKISLQLHSKNAVRGELLRHGISVSLLGAPNAGKSSLLNRIIGREAAIVSHQAGTTRDVVEVGIDLGGYFCRFGDTAGLRQRSHAATQAHPSGEKSTLEVIDQIEIEGMRRAKQRAADSDLVVVVLSFEEAEDSNRGQVKLNLDGEVCAVARELLQGGLRADNVILVINKSDLAVDAATRERALQQVQEELPKLGKDAVHLVSCLAEDVQQSSEDDPGGIQEFLQGLIGQFGKLTAALTPDGADGAAAVASSPAGVAAAATTTTSINVAEPDLSIWQESLGASERHRILLDACVAHLDAFLAETDPESIRQHIEDDIVESMDSHEADIVVAAEHLRSAADCLAKITGRGEAGDVEEVLGVVFEKFCVGK